MLILMKHNAFTMFAYNLANYPIPPVVQIGGHELP